MGGCLPFKRSFSAPASKRFADDCGEAAKAAHPALEALRAGRLAISFSGGGFLLPYFVGVAETLQQLGVLRPSTIVAGSSAGSLIAASLASGLSPERIFDSFLESVRDCRANGSYRRLEAVVGRQLESTLPPDAHVRCSELCTVGVTRLLPRLRTKRVSVFSGRPDLIAALMASCHIPRYFNGDFTTSFRGKAAVDGGITSLMPIPNQPHDFLLKVSCFPREHVARLPVLNKLHALRDLSLGISPDAFGQWPYSLKDMLAAALHPHTDDFIAQLREAGRSDAAKWAVVAGVQRLALADAAPSAGVGGLQAAAAAAATTRPAMAPSQSTSTSSGEASDVDLPADAPEAVEAVGVAMERQGAPAEPAEEEASAVGAALARQSAKGGA